MSAKPKASPLPAEPASEDIAEFKRLYEQVRKAHRKQGKKATADDPSHQAALAFAEARGWNWAVSLLEALRLAYGNDSQNIPSILDVFDPPVLLQGEIHFLRGIALLAKKDSNAAIDCFRKALESPGYDNPGHAWNNMGRAHKWEKDFDAAIECYRKALESPEYDTPGRAWNNLGNAYAGKKDFDAAIECYRKAIDSLEYDNPGNAWNNLGCAHAEKKGFDAAIECYRKALESPEYDTPGTTWHNLGNAYAGKKDFDAAIDCYRKAIESPEYDTPGRSWNNMGIAHMGKKDFVAAIDCYRKAIESPKYDRIQQTRLNLSTALRKIGELREAREEIERVLGEPDTVGQHARARLLLSLLEACNREIEPKPDEVALADPTPDALEDGPEDRMKNILLGKETRYDEYLARPVDHHPDDLTVLRGWSSSVTLLEGGTDCQWQGGGYFLKWQGKGIVLDPGFDFLDNFHEAGFHGKEVQAVLVSHNHPDHNADLGSLNDLCYELFRRSKEIPKSVFAMDEDTAARFPDDSPAHRGAPIKFTRGDHEMGRWLAKPHGLPLTVEHFPVEHGDDVRHAMGLRLRLHRPGEEKDLVIGYTGDGKFTESLVHHLQGVDLLIAHVSQPDTREFNDPEFLKEFHLGYNGVIKLVSAVKPRLTLVGEFWAGLADLRLDLIAGIRLRSGVPGVLPACLGLSLRLPDLTIRCTSCRSQVPFEKIKVTPPTREFGLLGYLCPKCIL